MSETSGGDINQQSNPQELSGPIEKKEFESENLKKLQQVVKRYNEDSIAPELVTWDEAHTIFSSMGTAPEELLSRDAGTIHRQKIIEVFNRISQLKFQGISYDPRPQDLAAFVQEDPREEFLIVHRARAFIFQSLSPQQQEENKVIIQEINQAHAFYKVAYLDSIIAEGQKFMQDDALSPEVFSISGKENPDSSQQSNKEVLELQKALRELLTETANPALKNAYKDLLYPLIYECHNSQVRYFNHRHDLVNTTFEPITSPAIIKIIAAIRPETWQALNLTPDQAHKIYDALQERLFWDLRQGGAESWDGTRAAMILGTLKDPRAIPGMIAQLRRFGPGHTNAAVAGWLKSIVYKPSSQEEFENTMRSASPLDRRIVEEWMLDQNSWPNKIQPGLTGDGGYTFASLVYNAEAHFAYQHLATLAKKLAGSKGVSIDEDVYSAYFLGNFGEWSHTGQIDELLLENIKEVGEIVAKSKITNLRETNPKLFYELVNPKNGDYFYFPRLIAAESLGLDPKYLGRLEQLYQLPDLKSGIFNKAQMAEGLLYLSSKPRGKQILESLLEATGDPNKPPEKRPGPSKKDPERIRHIFGILKTLEDLDYLKYYDYAPIIDARLGLHHTIEHIRQEATSLVIEKMELGEEEKVLLQEKFEKLVDTNVLQIIPTMLGSFRGSHKDRTAMLTREIGRHIIRGDFKEWRNGLETGQRQLEVLPEEKRTAWLNPISELTADLGVQKEGDLRHAAVDSIKRIVREAKAHVLDVYRLDFSSGRLVDLQAEQQNLVRQIREATTHEQKAELGLHKRLVDAEAKLIEGILTLENLDVTSFDSAKFIDIMEKTKSALAVLKGLEQPANDLAQIRETLTTQQELKTVSRLRAYETDDPLALLKSGTEPRETCQSWRQGSFNHCLPATAADLNKRVINVENERGEVLARTLIKLTHIKSGDQIRPVILVEPVYTNSELPQLYRLVAKTALLKARATGTDVILSRELVSASGTDHAKTIPVLRQEAEKLGFAVGASDVEVFIPQSANDHEYSDSLGGDITYFARYVPFHATIVSPR